MAAEEKKGKKKGKKKADKDKDKDKKKEPEKEVEREEDKAPKEEVRTVIIVLRNYFPISAIWQNFGIFILFIFFSINMAYNKLGLNTAVLKDFLIDIINIILNNYAFFL